MRDNSVGTSDGYWLIEMDELAFLTANPKLHSFAERVFAWIANEVSLQLKLPAKSLSLTVVKATYFGSYPCIAARHLSGVVSAATAKEIEVAISELIGQTTVKQFLSQLQSL